MSISKSEFSFQVCHPVQSSSYRSSPPPTTTMHSTSAAAAVSSSHPRLWHPSHRPAQPPSPFRAVLSLFLKPFSSYLLWPCLWIHAYAHTRGQRATAAWRFGGSHLAAAKPTYPSPTGNRNGAGWFVSSLAQVERWSLGMKGSELGWATERSGNGPAGPDTSHPRSYHKSENDFPVTARQGCI